MVEAGWILRILEDLGAVVFLEVDVGPRMDALMLGKWWYVPGPEASLLEAARACPGIAKAGIDIAYRRWIDLIVGNGSESLDCD